MYFSICLGYSKSMNLFLGNFTASTLPILRRLNDLDGNAILRSFLRNLLDTRLYYQNFSHVVSLQEICLNSKNGLILHMFDLLYGYYFEI